MKRFCCVAVLTGFMVFLRFSVSTALSLQSSPFDPPSDRNYTSSREIDRLEVAPDGDLTAFTGGGVLRFQNGSWRKITAQPSEVIAAKQIAQQWRGQKVFATLEGLHMGQGKTERIIPLPPSSGTHISALLPRGTVLWASLFGDGIWQWDGRHWTQPDLKLPALGREITSLAASRDNKTIWLGTRRQGIWSFQNGQWKQHLQPDEPFAHNVQFLQEFQGALWGSTLEDGLIVHDAHGWKHFGKEVLSSNAPRQMAVFHDKLYVRQSNEVVDCFDGQSWAKDVFPKLPRRQIISLAADEKYLYLGQWGGWSAWDGKTFSHHLKIPELQIVPLMQIFPERGEPTQGNLWLGTENRGLFEWDIKSQKLRQYDERDGLPDDWITSLNRNQDTLFAGTFNGGLSWRDGKETMWHSAPDMKRLGITAIVPDGPQRTLIGTRFGLFCHHTNGQIQSWNNGLSEGEREIQALLLTKTGLWLGTRNGLLFRTRATLDGNAEQVQSGTH